MASASVVPSTPVAASTSASAGDASNIEAFVASTTPVFIARRRAEDVRGDGETSSSSKDDDVSYVLSELWDAFVEPSAFGAEVPLRLQEGQDVSQYYVPFLSGVQLFVRGEAGEGEGGGEGGARKKPGAGTAELIFEFFEKSSPYTRASMSETIESILEENPRLREMTTRDLAPSSWMSVAWYPIYRIPQGTMLHDVQGCFLTYHALYVGELRDGDIACPLPPRMTDAQEALIDQRVKRTLERDGGGGDGRARVLRPFGLSMYKMQGDVWAANDDVTEWMNKLMDGAYTWLRMRKTVHPDYEFFSHFG